MATAEETSNDQPRVPGVIEIRIRNIAQLFDPFDPLPLPERDLNPRADDYIVSWAREFPLDAAFRILIYIPGSEIRDIEEDRLASGLVNYFASQALAVQRELKELFRVGRRYLSIGLPVLLLCFLTSQLVRAALGPGAFAAALEESLIIVG